jgi:hypothetical protein
MREMMRRAKTEELCVLKDAMLESKPITDTQIDIICDIVDELLERGEIAKPPDEDVRASYLRLVEEVGHDLPEDSSAAWDGLNEKLSGRDADPPRAKPKIRSRFLRPTLIAVSVATVLFCANTIAAYATGFNFFGMFAKWSQDAVYFVFGEPDEFVRDMDVAYLRLNDTLDELGIKVDLPRFAPDGTVIYSIEPAEPTDYLPIIAWFALRDDKFSIQITPTGATATFSERNDEEPSENYYKGLYLIEENIDRLLAVWMQNGFEIRIQGNLTYEELTEMLDSI